MFHVQPIDWEVIASHSIAPVQVIYETDDLRIRSLAPHEVQGSYTFDLHRQNPYPTPTASPAKLHKRLPSSAATPTPTTPIPTTQSTLASSPSSSSRKQITNPFDVLCPSGSRGAQKQKESEKEDSQVASTSGLSRSWSFKRILNTRRKSTDSTSSSGSSQGYSSIGSASSKLTTPQPELEEVPTTRTTPTPTTPKRHSSPSSLPHSPVAEEKKPQFFTQNDVKKALKFARAQLKAEIAKSSGGKYNSMIVEGWDLTVSHNQQLSKYRIQINYHARPATLVFVNQQQQEQHQHQQQPSAGWLEVKKEPPYLAILEQL